MALPNTVGDSSITRPILGYDKKNSGFAAPPTRKSYLQWVPTDEEQLRDAEARMLKPIAGHYEQTVIKTPLCDINTVYSVTAHHTKHIVLLHGFGFGLAQWVPNLTTFAQLGNVYAIDMPGFARSGRATCSGGGQEAILYFIQTLEEWIKAMWSTDGAPKITLVGHSFGGFVAGKFALNYPERIESLMLVDPFGVNEGLSAEVVEARAAQRGSFEKARNWAASKLFYGVNPLCPLRGLGPLGPKLVGPKMAKKRDTWEGHTEPGAVVDYLYHANAQSPSGEKAFSKTVTGLGAGLGDGFVAKFPLLNELPNLPPHIPLHFIYGSHTWIPHSAGHQVVRVRAEKFQNEVLPAEVARRSALPDNHPDLAMPLPTLAAQAVFTIPNSGHHVYVENSKRFNGIVTEILCPRKPIKLKQPQLSEEEVKVESSLRSEAASGSGSSVIKMVLRSPAVKKEKKEVVESNKDKEAESKETPEEASGASDTLPPLDGSIQ